MEDELQEMLEHFRIRKVLAEYCRGSDRADEPLMASNYAADSWDDHGVVAQCLEQEQSLFHTPAHLPARRPFLPWMCGRRRAKRQA